MQIEANLLIDDLLTRTEKSITAVQKFKQLTTGQLNFKRGREEWSVLECIEHLNLYGDFYLPEIETRMLAKKGRRHDPIFKSGVLGNYFANLMQVKDGKVKKMKSPKDKNPVNSALTVITIDRFLKQLEKLKSLLMQSRNVDFTKTKTAISLTNFVRLRLGDTFRFFIYHIERHILQAERAQVI
ncbi:MAG: DinB family protein [Chitinophagaceae bacterium]